MTQKKPLTMELHQVEWIGETGIKRVFGGWIYMFHDDKTDTITSSVFVPEVLNCNTKTIS